MITLVQVSDWDEDEDGGDDGGEGDGEVNLVDINDRYVVGTADLTEAEESVVDKFLHSNKKESCALADIVMHKLKEKKEESAQLSAVSAEGGGLEEDGAGNSNIPPKVVEGFTAVGKMLYHYKSGKLPKALKMLPHLKNWEQVLWLTRPDEWSPAATYASTRIFASNLNEKIRGL